RPAARWPWRGRDQSFPQARLRCHQPKECAAPARPGAAAHVRQPRRSGCESTARCGTEFPWSPGASAAPTFYIIRCDLQPTIYEALMAKAAPSKIKKEL